MNAKQAKQLAQDAMDVVAVGEPESVADTTVLVLNADGTYSVCDNGEEVAGLTEQQAIDIIVENLTA